MYIACDMCVYVQYTDLCTNKHTSLKLNTSHTKQICNPLEGGCHIYMYTSNV